MFMTTELFMKKPVKHLMVIGNTILATTLCSGLALADPLFFDDFEDRVKDQPLIGPGAIGGPGWTWYNQTYSDDLVLAPLMKTMVANTCRQTVITGLPAPKMVMVATTTGRALKYRHGQQMKEKRSFWAICSGFMAILTTTLV